MTGSATVTGLEQLTYLIFLKMADGDAKPPYNRDCRCIPVEYNWPSLKSKRGAKLEGHYIALLRELGTKKGMLTDLPPRPRMQDPGSGETLSPHRHGRRTEWVTMGADIKGDIYEDLLERNAEDTVRRRPVFHAARPHPRHGRIVRPEPWQTHRRSGLRHGAGFGRLRLHHQPGLYGSSSIMEHKGVPEARGVSR